MNSELENVYTGSIVEAKYLVELLNENNIGSILRDSLSESVVAGWGSGSPEDAVTISVELIHLEEATKIIQDYFKSR